MLDKEEKLKRLRSMLGLMVEESSGGLESAGATGLEGLELPATDEAEAGARGAQKVTEGRVEAIDDFEMDGLEAIVMPTLRPVVFIRGGEYEKIEEPWGHLNEPEARSLLQPLFASIGRIELPTSTLAYGGTGFVVGDGLVMTNRHVAQLFANGLGDRRIRFRAGDAAVDFKREEGRSESETLAVREVVMIHPFWDMALLRVDGLAPRHPKLTLATREPEAMVGRDVVVVGYPARDGRNDLDLQDRIFKRRYDVKRLQPGKLRTRQRVNSFGNDVLAITHDSSTLGGNSGSAVIDAVTGAVVALHFGGRYLEANYGVPAYELARDARVVDKGVNFGAAVASTTDWSRSWAFADGNEGGAPRPDPVPNAAPSAAGAAAPPAVVAGSPGAPTATFTIPLHISISIGAPTGGAPRIEVVPSGPAVIAPIERPMQVPIIKPRLSQRRGYQPDFLGDAIDVPLPTLTDKGRRAAAKLDDDSTELRYHHFSVVMHKGRRMALFTAANVDWRKDKRLVDGRKPTRSELSGIPEGVAEQWVTDPRIPDDHQLPDDFYTRDRGAFDKGHLVRRDDVCWGSSFDDIQKANGDTYHTTNCSPQVGAFNQSAKGEDNWGDLENMVAKETKAERVITFSGPVFADDDPVFKGHDLRGEVDVQIPRSYWKIIVAAGDDGPLAYGFQLKQSLRGVKFTEELTVPPEWERYMVAIDAIEELLRGWVRLDWLKQRDGRETSEGRRMSGR